MVTVGLVLEETLVCPLGLQSKSLQHHEIAHLLVARGGLEGLVVENHSLSDFSGMRRP